MSKSENPDSLNLPQVEPVATLLDEQIAQAIDTKTNPPGSLGRIEALAAQIARVQQTLESLMNSCSLTIFAADHGIATACVSAFPREVSRQMVLNFVAEGAAALLAHKLTGQPLAQFVGRGTGVDDDGLVRKLAVLERAGLSVRSPGAIAYAVFGSAAVILPVRQLFMRKPDGYTADCLGTVQQAGELGFYLGLAA